MVNKQIKTTAMGLVFLKKMVNGKPTYETRRFRNVRNEASAENIKAVAEAMVKVSEGQYESLELTEEKVIL